uniref:Amino AcidPolyamineOrganocation (APC) Family putati n=1 Tax=Albugo laibachii Nc14 TaxID=890382 RepID=F0WNX5_9STRA|nr:Amino AcidPolyamineOrganocation (APC) Family putati [Albugo laibachii Nc14]|eukprot:CCA23018.1 Amino AcidPolyamineOrganocation (APC) Family putati [Albugo laibachii Nc14]
MQTTCRSLFLAAFWRKPREYAPTETATSSRSELARTLGLFDLLMIGIGGTVGTGVFATAGVIAHTYAGPGAILSWLLAGFGCVMSGVSFMELSSLIPSAGSTYAYAYHAIGELPAVIAGFLLTLEYGISSAGGARSWSDKLSTWLSSEFGLESPLWVKSKDSVIDLYAGGLMTLCVVIVLSGMQSGKIVVNVVTMTKISVILCIIFKGFCHFQVENVTPFIPKMEIRPDGRMEYGWPGVLLGASASFYGYIGFDEVCCLAGEAKNPAKNIPKAVLGTIFGAAILSTFATTVLVGMQRFQDINVDESYGQAFISVGSTWIAKLVSTGEVLTMPITCFISFLAQPRVQFAMARDGLLPPVFAELDANGNLTKGTRICGVMMIAIAMCIPFHLLWNLISLGILVAFNLTNASLLAIRADGIESKGDKKRHKRVLMAYVLVSLVTAYVWEAFLTKTKPGDAYEVYIALLLSVLMIGLMVALRVKSTAWRTLSMQEGDTEMDLEIFRAPLVPWTPCVAIFFNWFLFCQMDTFSVLLIVLWLLMAVGCYLWYGSRHSLGNQQIAYKLLEKSKAVCEGEEGGSL